MGVLGWLIFLAGIVVGVLGAVLAFYRWLIKEWELW
jgi:hypothetical protein